MVAGHPRPRWGSEESPKASEGPLADGLKPRWETDRYAMHREFEYRFYLVGCVGERERDGGGEREGEEREAVVASSEEGQKESHLERRLEIQAGDWEWVGLIS